MPPLALWPRVAPFSSRQAALVRGWRILGAAVVALVLAGTVRAEEPAGPPPGEFGKAIQLAPFVINGSKLSISIHARTKADRRYAEKFADEVVEIAYETLGDSTGKGLVIVGAEGEPHPILVVRKFLELARAGQLDPSLTPSAAEVEVLLKKVQEKMKMEVNGKSDISFETILPAVPLPLEGVASKLYQVAWAEGFDAAKVEAKLKALTRADLSRDELNRYNWVFYLPPYKATTTVFKDIVNKVMAAEKMGLFKRAAVRSALFVFGPVVRQAIEGLRKGMLYMTILRAESHYNEGDVNELTKVYIGELMPDLKPGSGDERKRALAAIAKQKIANVEYAKDPFVKPARLATFDPAAYAACEGEYIVKPEALCRFVRAGDSFQWNYKQDKPRVFYPAGDRLLVNEDGTMTIRFVVDEKTGAVTGVEERWVRRRQTLPRKTAVQAPAVAAAK